MQKRSPPTSTSFLLVKTTKKVHEESKREGAPATGTNNSLKGSGGGLAQPSLSAKRGFKFAKKQEVRRVTTSNKTNLTPRKVGGDDAQERGILARMPKELRALVEP